MVKQVGTNGQTEPGKRSDEIVQVSDGWLPPGGYDECTQWALDNREALEQYARQIEQHGTAADQLQRFLAEHPEMMADDHGEI